MSRCGLIGVVFAMTLSGGGCGGSSDSDSTATSPSTESAITETSSGTAQVADRGQTAAARTVPTVAPARASETTATPAANSTTPPPPPTIATAPTTTLPYDTSRYYEVDYEGRTYLCESSFSIDECAIYFGGAAPVIISADLYCDPIARRCAEYDPSQFEEIWYAGDNYLCDMNTFGAGYDCVRYSGGPSPSFFTVDLYCSGFTGPSECSPLWYPDELSRYTMVTIDGNDYLCDEALTGRYGDQDCFRYSGGNPSVQASGFPDLYCSDDLGRLSCDTSYYPSEWDGYELVRIDSWDYVCRSGFGGQECYRWYGTGSPSDAVLGLPDYYCNFRGCSPDGYP